MTKMNLEPCPFCGGKADFYCDDYGIHAFCTKCDSRTGDFETRDEVLNSWNSRPIEDNKVKYESTSYSCRACRNATDSEIRRLREALEEIKDAITLLNTVDVLEHISDKINQTLKGKEE